MKQYYGISVGVVLFLIFVAFRLIYQNSDYSQDSKFEKNEVEQAIENYIQKETDNVTAQDDVEIVLNNDNNELEITARNINFICDVFLSNRNNSCNSSSSYSSQLRENLYKILETKQNIVAVSKSQMFDGPSYKILHERSFFGYTNTPELDVVEGCNKQLRNWEFSYEDCVVVIQNSIVVNTELKNRIIALQTNN